MMYPIWNKIQSCVYANKSGSTGNKSYGIREHGETNIVVGTSAKNSHDFITHKTTHKLHENGDREYHFYISELSGDMKLIRRAILRKNANVLEFIE